MRHSDWRPSSSRKLTRSSACSSSTANSRHRSSCSIPLTERGLPAVIAEAAEIRLESGAPNVLVVSLRPHVGGHQGVKLVGQGSAAVPQSLDPGFRVRFLALLESV